MLTKNHRKLPTRGFERLGIAIGSAIMATASLALSQSAPELSVSVMGRLQRVAGQAAEQQALVQLEWTPPSSASPRAGAASVSFTEAEADLEAAPGSELPLDPLERDEFGGSPAAPTESRRGREGPAKQQALLKEVPFVLSPTYVRAAVDAALAAQGVIAALGRLDSLSSRARVSAMFPDVRLRAGRDLDQSLRLTPTVEDPYRYTRSGGVSLVLEAAVTWRLGRVLFAGEELSIARLRLAQMRERQRVVSVTLNALLAWQTASRRVQVAGDRWTQAAEDLFEAGLRLDVLTDGWFSAHQPGALFGGSPTPFKDGADARVTPTADSESSAPSPPEPKRRRPTSNVLQQDRFAPAPPPRQRQQAHDSSRDVFGEDSFPQLRHEQLEGLALSR